MLRGKYRIPFYMSTDCENILKKFLVLNPTKRATLEVCNSYFYTFIRKELGFARFLSCCEIFVHTGFLLNSLL